MKLHSACCVNYTRHYVETSLNGITWLVITSDYRTDRLDLYGEISVCRWGRLRS